MAGGTTPDLGDITCTIDFVLVLMLAAFEIIADPGVKNPVLAIEVVPVRVLRDAYGGRLSSARSHRRSNDIHTGGKQHQSTSDDVRGYVPVGKLRHCTVADEGGEEALICTSSPLRSEHARQCSPRPRTRAQGAFGHHRYRMLVLAAMNSPKPNSQVPYRHLTKGNRRAFQTTPDQGRGEQSTKNSTPNHSGHLLTPATFRLNTW